LFAKLKTAIEPTAKVEPIAVITIKLIWDAARPKERGSVNLKTLLTPG